MSFDPDPALNNPDFFSSFNLFPRLFLLLFFPTQRTSDCESLVQKYKTKKMKRATTKDTECNMYIVPLSKSVQNFAPTFQHSDTFNTYQWINPNAPDWLLSLLPTHQCTTYMVPPISDYPEDAIGQHNFVVPSSSSSSSSPTPTTFVLLIASLHTFGKNTINLRAKLMAQEAQRIQQDMDVKSIHGVVVGVVADDEFNHFPLPAHEAFDLIFTVGDWDPRVCGIPTSSCGRVFWLPRGPSPTFFTSQTSSVTAAGVSTTSDHHLPETPASKTASTRKYFANFIGNIDASLCISVYSVINSFGDQSLLKTEMLGAQLLKTCYRPSSRPAALKGLQEYATTLSLLLPTAAPPPAAAAPLSSMLLLRPTSGYGLNEIHGNNVSSSVGQSMTPSKYALALAQSIFTVCAPSTSTESTRIYEALEMGSIPILPGPLNEESGLLFNIAGSPPCPIPFIHAKRGEDWKLKLPMLLETWRLRGSVAIDELQNNVSMWWKHFKKETKSNVERRMFESLARRRTTGGGEEGGGEGGASGQTNVPSPSVDLDALFNSFPTNDGQVDPASPPPPVDGQWDFSGLQPMLSKYRRMIHTKSKGHVVYAKKVITALLKKAQNTADMFPLHGRMAAGTSSTNLRALRCAAWISYYSKLWSEFDCLTQFALHFDPYSLMLHDMLAHSYWIREYWKLWKSQQQTVKLLIQQYKHNKITMRYPLVTRRMEELRESTLSRKLFFLKLNQCLNRENSPRIQPPAVLNMLPKLASSTSALYAPIEEMSSDT